MVARNWIPLSRENIVKATEDMGADWFILITDALGETHTGRLKACGELSIDLDNWGQQKRVVFANRAMQFMLVARPSPRQFKAQEEDLFNRKST